MGIFKRPDSDRYWVKFMLRGRSYVKSTGTTNPAEARRIEAEWRVEIRDEQETGKATAPATEMTFGDAVVRYAEEVVAAKRGHNLPSTLVSTEARLAQLTDHLGADVPLDRITPDVLASYRGRLLRDGLKPGSVNRQLSVVRAILNRAHAEWGALASVPRIKRLDVHDQRERVLEGDEQERLLAASTPDLADFLSFLLGTGARKAEALLVAWSDFELGERPAVTLTTRKAKRSLRRRVPLTPTLAEQMRARKAANSARVWPWRLDGMTGQGRKGKAGRRVARCTLSKPVGVYPNKAGGWDARIRVDGKLVHLLHTKDRAKAVAARMAAEVAHYGDGSDASLDRQFERAVDQAGITDFGFHDCRHTYASTLARRGVSLGLIGTLLGHSDARLTARYSHWRAGDLDDAVVGALG